MNAAYSIFELHLIKENKEYAKDFKIIWCPWSITIHPIHHQEIYSTFNIICSYSWTFIHVQRFKKLLGSTEAWNEQKSFLDVEFGISI